MKATELLLQHMVTDHGFKSTARARYYCESFLGNTPLEGKSVLEIGCGEGWLGLYAACEGALRVVGLEPEADGSRSDVLGDFRRLGEKLGLGQVRASGQVFQRYDPENELFDLVLMRSVVNHLDEEACIRLRKDPVARERYLTIFRKLAAIMRPGGRVIITDCSPFNFFPTVGLRNPMHPSIDWHKHQSPKVWVTLLSQCGFCDASVRWVVQRPLVPLGPLVRNEFVTFFLGSKFRLTMTRK